MPSPLFNMSTPILSFDHHKMGVVAVQDYYLHLINEDYNNRYHLLKDCHM